MKKLFLGMAMLAMLSAPVFASGSSETASSNDARPYEGQDLVVATWGWSASNLKKLSAHFEEKYGCTILIDETNGNSDRLNKLMAQKNNPEIDVAILSDNFAQIGIQKGLFDKIDKSVVTSWNELYPFAQQAEGYGPSYSLVRYGILYNADMVPEPKSYMDLFNGNYDGLLSLPDMAGTAGPYLLVSLAEDLGDSQENIDGAMKILEDNKDNVASFYMSGSTVQTGFTTGEVAAAVFMDMNLPLLNNSGLNIKWSSPAEGSFSAAATANVVKGCENPELAQLFIEYLISEDVQNQVADVLSEAPCNSKATMSAEKAQYLASGEEAFASIKQFDLNYINEHKADWIKQFQRSIAN